ncbi:hypothetical protein [Azohydromonas aeria]|uniref:hypothetical protein n=1 Tax=Azohydromonas aeria TaxID=2590212 RepID=UPI0012F8E5FF|nr:hypothetical protein [Azohydromonas aeria]
MNTLDVEQPGYELRFESLIDPRRACAFPCDARGQVDLDRLGEQALHRYLYARALIGGEFGRPVVQRRAEGSAPHAN